ncbi:MAG: M18 family aminopeptidase [Lachnospiraceae bacterium]|jgi:aspartyl aminopeptidase|nr:M18 family aminopeptidase [Lachnospiraceae bacterium]MCI8996792.1 M18 family aminopeptidase [Lachnospiraceae bacterium]MCI9134769.1 M18 family aminopeptidase [Lachnospiraceae bacterium]
MHKKTDSAEKLFAFIEEGTSPFHVVQAVVRRLRDAGFEELKLGRDWCLNNGGRYFMIHHGSSLLAFTIGEHFTFRDPVRIAAAHTDFPGLRIKTKPEVEKEGYRQLNVEVYGGAILNTWLDRPLSAAGRVALRSSQAFYPRMRLVDLKKPLFTVPNVAIHLEKEINKGLELNRQKDLLPLAGLAGEDEEKKLEEFFLHALARKLQVEPEEILDFELGLYNTDRGEFLGLEEEFLSAPRLDDLTGVEAVLEGIVETSGDRGIHVAAFFDHEEIGSKTKQGAGSALLSMVLEKILLSFGRDRQQFLEIMSDAMLLSVDVGHAIHPNKADKSDITAKGILGKGLLIKENSGQAYATDCEAIAVVQQLCLDQEIDFQKVTNRSDVTGGSTLGPIASAMLPVRTVDIGVPLLAMHSARELMGTRDQEELARLLKAYFS